MILANSASYRSLVFIAFVLLLFILLSDNDQSFGVDARKHRRSWKGAALAHHSKAYKLRKGSRLERQHRRSMHNWRKGYLNSLQHEKQKVNKGSVERILSQMDSLVRPRFGRR